MLELDNVSTTKYSYFTPTSINIGTSVSLANNSASPSFGNSYEFSRAAISTNISNKNTPTNTAAGAFTAVRNKLTPRPHINSENLDKSDLIARNAIEKRNIDDENVLNEEVKNSELLGEFFGLSCVSVVEKRPSLPDNVKSVAQNTSDTKPFDTINEYEQNDLKNVNKRDMLRTANPILNSLRKDQSSSNSNLMNYSLTNNSSKLKKNINNWNISNKTPTEYLKKGPNQIKALIKLSDEFKNMESNNPFREDIVKFLSQGITEANADEFRYKFQTINKLEVLTTFDGVKQSDSLGLSKDPQLALPKWQILTKEILEKNKGKDLLARLVPFEDKVLQIKRDKNYELPTYDDYFIIKGN
jgi:hypothetical protein